MSAEEAFLCARCARHQKTCCQHTDILTTLGDVGRISQHVGHGDFTEFRAPENPAYLDQDDDPLWRELVFRPDNTRRVLRRESNGDCTFLGTNGCSLPLETRPLICRLYPYDYTADGLSVGFSDGCPLELLRPGQGLIDALEMNPADAQRWHRQLYDELNQEIGGGNAHRTDL